jgi:hypothetical protein
VFHRDELIFLANVIIILPVSLPATELGESGVVSIDAQQSATRLVLQRRPMAFTFGCIDRYA